MNRAVAPQSAESTATNVDIKKATNVFGEDVETSGPDAVHLGVPPSKLSTDRSAPDSEDASPTHTAGRPSPQIRASTGAARPTDMREAYRIPNTFLVSTQPVPPPPSSTTPLIAFVNGRSGGQVGSGLLRVLSESLGAAQVFDLSQVQPGLVLASLWANLEAGERAGDRRAAQVKSTLRVLVAGGDGTVTWVLKTILDLKLSPPPAVAIMPLGTGNDLSLSLGWGNAFAKSWVQSRRVSTPWDSKGPKGMEATLQRYAASHAGTVDCWRVTLTGPRPAHHDALPHALSVSETGSVFQCTGLFWNYLSIGLDAKAAYGFHTLREARPWAASNRLVNQSWYTWFTCSSGWFCGGAPLRRTLSLRVRRSVPLNQRRPAVEESEEDEEARGDCEEEWETVLVPPSIRAIVLLNLQSYGGGRDIWGLADKESDSQNFEPFFDDGLIEVVGFGTGWHAAAVMGQLSPKIHARRLAQGCAVDIRMHGPGAEDQHTFMQVDGEPWRQSLPDRRGLRIRVEHAGQSAMLFNADDIQGSRRVRRIAQRATGRALEGGGLHVPSMGA